MDVVAIEFTPTPEDYKKSSLAFLSRNFWLWALSGWLGIPVIVLVIVSWVTLGIAAINFKGSVIAIAIGYVVTMYPYSIPASSMRQAIRNKKLCLPIKYTFDEKEISATTNELEVKYRWSTFGKVFESDLFYFFVQENEPNSFQFIPKRSFDNSMEENKFRSLAIKQISEIQMLGKGVSGWKLALVSSVISLIINYSVLTMIGD